MRYTLVEIDLSRRVEIGYSKHSSRELLVYSVILYLMCTSCHIPTLCVILMVSCELNTTLVHCLQRNLDGMVADHMVEDEETEPTVIKSEPEDEVPIHLASHSVAFGCLLYMYFVVGDSNI